MTLAVINWLYSDLPLSFSFATWFVLLCIVLSVIYLTKFIQQKFLTTWSKDSKYLLRNFESRAFALGITYSFTVILAASIYKNASTSYLSNTDDVSPVSDDSLDHPMDWLFFAYVLFITASLILVQTRLDKRLDERLEECSEGGDNNSNSQQHTQNPLSSNDRFNYKSNVKTAASSSSNKNNTNSDSGINETVAERKRNSCFLSCCYFWDDDLSTLEAYRCFVMTAFGDLVACGWFIWSLLSFQVRSRGLICEYLVFVCLLQQIMSHYWNVYVLVS